MERTCIGTGSCEGDLSVDSVPDEAKVRSVIERAGDRGGVASKANP